MQFQQASTAAVARCVERSAARVDHLDLRSRCRVPDIAHLESRAAEPDAHRSVRAVKFAIVGARRDDVLHAGAGHRRRREPTHQEPRNRGVAVREMKLGRDPGLRVARGGEAHARRRARLEVEALKTREVERPDLERPDRLDPDPPFLMRHFLEVGQDAWIGLDRLGQVVRIAHPGEL